MSTSPAQPLRRRLLLGLAGARITLVGARKEHHYQPGYTFCPLITRIGRAILSELGYEGKLTQN